MFQDYFCWCAPIEACYHHFFFFSNREDSEVLYENPGINNDYVIMVVEK